MALHESWGNSVHGDVVDFPVLKLGDREWSYRNATGGNSDKPKILVGLAPAFSILPLNTNRNVRGMLADSPKEYTPVHQKIAETVEYAPERFHVLNGGITIVASGAQWDHNTGVIHLADASIVNGANTQGVLKHIHDEYERSLLAGEEVSNPLEHVRVFYKILIVDDPDWIGDISVALNYQNQVEFLSILGSQHRLDDLAKSMASYDPSYLIRKSETGTERIDTEKLIQVITAITPSGLLDRIEFPESVYRPQPWHAYTLSKSLRNFKDISDPQYRSALNPLYEFMVQIAPYAWDLYEYWRSERVWASAEIKPNRKRVRKNGTQVENRRTSVTNENPAPDGNVFPVLSGLSIFCERRNGSWTIRVPKGFKVEKYIDAFVPIYKRYKSDPSIVGRNKSAYEEMLIHARSVFSDLEKDLKIERLEKQLAGRA